MSVTSQPPSSPLTQPAAAPDLRPLPLGAVLLAASLQALAQPGAGADAAGTLAPVTVTGQQEPAEIRGKSTLKPETTRLGKGEQSLRDIPQNVTVMTERLLDDRNLDDFRDVLRTTAGITFQAGETGEEDIRLRGFSLGQAGDVYRDGLREAQLITRDTFATERFEVLKGSASMLFGKGSTGGVVNQVTKQPFVMDRYELEATVGSGRHRRVQADLNKQVDTSSAVRLNAMVQDTDNWGAKDDRRGLSVGWRTGIGERNEFQVDLYHLKTEQRPIYNHPWLLTGNAGDLRRTLVPVLPAKNFYGLASDYLDSEQNVLTLTHTHRFGPNEELRTTLRHGRYERDLWTTVVSFCQNNASLCPGQTVSLANPPDPNTILSRNNFKGRRGISEITQLQSDYSNRFEAGGLKHHLTAGIDITDEDAKRNSNNGGGALPNTAPLGTLITRVGTPNDGARRDDTRTWIYNTFNAKSVGLYAQDTIALTTQWRLVGGLRFDRFEADYVNRDTTNGNVIATGSRRDNLWSPRVGAIWEPDATSSYYVSYGQSYNTSGDTYQFSLGNFAPGSGNAKAANTPPEKSRNVEVGGKWELFDRQALVGLALFRSEKYNERNTDPDSAATQALLSGKRHATGLEINLAGRISPKWEVFYNHTWIPSAKIDRCNAATCNPTGVAQREGDRPGLTPKHSASAWTTYRVTPQWRVGLGFTHRSEQNPEGNRTVFAPSFTTWDGMMEYTVDEKTTIKLNVTNLTDKLYADALYRGFYAPGAPRRVFLSMKTVF